MKRPAALVTRSGFSGTPGMLVSVVLLGSLHVSLELVLYCTIKKNHVKTFKRHDSSFVARRFRGKVGVKLD
jgi:hypothetical protein